MCMAPAGIPDRCTRKARRLELLCKPHAYEGDTVDWSQVLAGLGVVTAIVVAGFAMGRNEWNKSTMDRFHTANNELREDNDDLRDQITELRAAVKAEHVECEQRLAEEVQTWAQKVGHLEGQIETFQTERVDRFITALQDGVLTAVQSGVEQAIGTASKNPTVTRDRGDG